MIAEAAGGGGSSRYRSQETQFLNHQVSVKRFKNDSRFGSRTEVSRGRRFQPVLYLRKSCRRGDTITIAQYKSSVMKYQCSNSRTEVSRGRRFQPVQYLKKSCRRRVGTQSLQHSSDEISVFKFKNGSQQGADVLAGTGLEMKDQCSNSRLLWLQCENS